MTAVCSGLLAPPRLSPARHTSRTRWRTPPLKRRTEAGKGGQAPGLGAGRLSGPGCRVARRGAGRSRHGGGIPAGRGPAPRAAAAAAAALPPATAHAPPRRGAGPRPCAAPKAEAGAAGEGLSPWRPRRRGCPRPARSPLSVRGRGRRRRRPPVLSCPLLSVSGFGPWPRGGGRALPGRGLLPARQQPSGGGVGAGCRAGPRLRVCRPAGWLLPWSPAAASRQGRTVVCLSPPLPAPPLRPAGAVGLWAPFAFKPAKAARTAKSDLPGWGRCAEPLLRRADQGQVAVEVDLEKKSGDHCFPRMEICCSPSWNGLGGCLFLCSESVPRNKHQ